MKWRIVRSRCNSRSRAPFRSALYYHPRTCHALALATAGRWRPFFSLDRRIRELRGNLVVCSSGGLLLDTTHTLYRRAHRQHPYCSWIHRVVHALLSLSSSSKSLLILRFLSTTQGKISSSETTSLWSYGIRAQQMIFILCVLHHHVLIVTVALTKTAELEITHQSVLKNFFLRFQ